MKARNEWIEYRLDEIAEIQGGGTPSRNVTEYFGGTIPWVTPTDLPAIGQVSTLGKVRESITDAGLANSSAKLIPAGAVLFSSRASIGKIALTHRPCTTNQGFANFIPNPALVDQWFLAFLLARHTPEIVSLAGKTTFLEVPRGKLRAYRVAIPPIDEQRRIVNRINECLTRVKEIQVVSESLEPDYQSLKFAAVSKVISSLKERHATSTIGELVNGDSTAMRSGPFGSAMKHGEFVNDGNLVIGIANVQENRFDPVRKWMITDEKFEEMKRYEVQPGDLLITIMGTIGRTCVVPDGIGRAITSKHVYRIRLPKNICSRFVSFIVNYDFDARQQLYGSAIGGVMPGLNATKLRDLRICVPPIGVQERAADQLEEMQAAISERSALKIAGDLGLLRESILRRAFAKGL